MPGAPQKKTRQLALAGFFIAGANLRWRFAKSA